MARIIQITEKLTSAKKKSDKRSPRLNKSLTALLVCTMWKDKRDVIAVIPKKIPTLFQLPITDDVRSVKMPKDKKVAPNTMRARRKSARMIAEISNAT